MPEHCLLNCHFINQVLQMITSMRFCRDDQRYETHVCLFKILNWGDGLNKPLESEPVSRFTLYLQ